MREFEVIREREKKKLSEERTKSTNVVLQDVMLSDWDSVVIFFKVPVLQMSLLAKNQAFLFFSLTAA